MSDRPSNVKHFDRILVGVDDSDDSQLAFRYALNRAKEDDAILFICSILESQEMNVFQALSKDYVHGEREELEQHLNDYRKLAEDFGIDRVHTVVDEGEAGETIVKSVIPHIEPDVLIIGSKSKKGLSRRFGSQAAYMAKYAPISVFVIR
ncbi:universal stress protein [Agrilactobacillus fermenti]|uniref:universal stress protein n=1 Tax=Agrilactobacillus fermenti TaxID=2586909 RepID=UPI001E2FEBF8|nr:universal stress protein [Agrilactobacillus fermenti]MCD2256515.1 universal stress protein [Agrilactobacillus fermenti]